MNDSLSKLKMWRNDPKNDDTGFSGSSRASEKKAVLFAAVDHFRSNVFRSSLLARSKMPRCRFDKPLPARLM